MAKDLLNLKTTDDVDHVVIDGERYALADSGSFTTMQVADLRRKTNALAALETKPDITDEEARQADAWLDELFRAIAPSIPDELARKLTPMKRGMVVQAFFLRVAEIRAAATQPSSASPSSPASSASSAAVPKAG